MRQEAKDRTASHAVFPLTLAKKPAAGEPPALLPPVGTSIALLPLLG